MAKGDDTIQKKKNKANRKKLSQKQSSSNVSARIASIIASKKRRQAGKRRMCQGMCFSLPTLDDPFNERHGKKEFLPKETKKVVKSVKGNPKKNKGDVDHLGEKVGNRQPSKSIQLKEAALDNSNDEQYLVGCSYRSNTKQGCAWDSDCPSKFLIMCLKTIESSLPQEIIARNGENNSPLFLNSWGVEFWKLYTTGKDILETSGGSSSVEKIAWIVSTAADSIAKKEKEGLSFTSPFLLYLVPSKEKSSEVRSICKPLKALGIHSVSIHAGASLEHQIQGLKSCEPEFLVSTPERLLELISVKAIDISGVSLLVVDGMGTLSVGIYDTIQLISKFISGDPHTIIFKDSYSGPALKELLKGSTQRLCLDDSISGLSSCIV